MARLCNDGMGVKARFHVPIPTCLGTRMVWIFLRGLTRETAHWGSFPDEFRQNLPAAQVISLDLPGNGRIYQDTSPLSIGVMVSFCRIELSLRKVKPPYFLLAMSLGAMVATEWSYRFPEEIAGCVLINTSFQAFSPFYRRLRPRNYLALVKLALLTTDPGDVERVILRLTSREASKRAGVIPAWIEARVDRPVTAINALRQLLAALRYSARAAPPATALLILCSEHDGLVHFSCSQAIASSWNCALGLHPSAGHDIPLDDPAWVIERVQRWLLE